jgi:hypothetical protein
MPESALVSVETFVSRVQADLAHGALIAAGIDAVVSSDDAGGAYPAMTQGLRLLVRSEDAARARDVLSSTVRSEHDVPGQ